MTAAGLAKILCIRVGIYNLIEVTTPPKKKGLTILKV